MKQWVRFHHVASTTKLQSGKAKICFCQHLDTKIWYKVVMYYVLNLEMCVLKLSELSLFSSRCFIPNIYAALFTAALVPLMCLVVVFVVFIHAYQVKPQWKAYDDIFRGRTNAAGLEGTVFALWRWELFMGGEMSLNIFIKKKRVKLDSAFSSEAVS